LSSILGARLHEIGKAPSSIKIILDRETDFGRYGMVDVLPLIKMRHANPKFKIRFVCSPEKVAAMTRDQRGYFASEPAVLGRFIYNKHPSWVENIKNGNVVQMLFGPLFALGYLPEVRLTLLLDAESLRAEDEAGEKGRAMGHLEWLNFLSPELPHQVIGTSRWAYRVKIHRVYAESVS
jgi:hypothetical protein